MIVKGHAKSFSNQIADHRPGPHSRSEASSLRTGIDEQRQLRTLRLTDFGRVARSLSCTQAVGSHRLEPLKPAIDRPARHIEFGSQRYDRLLREIRHHSLHASPGRQIARFLRLPEQLPQSSQLRGSAPSPADSLPVLRATHDHLQTGRNHALLILSASFVNQVMDPAQRDPV